MEKKIRVTLPNYVLDILEGDAQDFKKNKNLIFNYIYSNMKNEDIDKKKEFNVEKKVIQFNLNRDNREDYYEFLKDKKIQVEAEFFRNLFMKYINQPKMKREIFIFKEIIKKIELAINEKKIMMITFMDGRKIEVEPYYIGSSQQETTNYLFCYNLEEKRFKNYKINNINFIFITGKMFCDRNQDFIESVKKNFDPFLSQGKRIKVSLTEKGEKLFKELLLNRPHLLKKEENVYELQCSDDKAKRYFTYFFDEVEVLEPLELRNWFKERYREALKKYEKNN
ncbi:MAG: WYL domain-containing protein [Fusobacteriaceae bacterium]